MTQASRKFTAIPLVRVEGNAVFKGKRKLRGNPAEKEKSLSEIRNEIDEIDNHLVALLERRLNHARKIGSLKRLSELPIKDEKREKELFSRLETLIDDPGLAPYISFIFKQIVEQSMAVQVEVVS